MENSISANEEYRIAVADSLCLEPLLEGRQQSQPEYKHIYTEV